MGAEGEIFIEISQTRAEVDAKWSKTDGVGARTGSEHPRSSLARCAIAYVKAAVKAGGDTRARLFDPGLVGVAGQRGMPST